MQQRLANPSPTATTIFGELAEDSIQICAPYEPSNAAKQCSPTGCIVHGHPPKPIIVIIGRRLGWTPIVTIGRNYSCIVYRKDVLFPPLQLFYRLLIRFME